MSDAQQFLSGGVPKPSGQINGTSVLPRADLPYNPFVFANSGYVKNPVTGSLTANTLATVLNLSGRGVISFLACSPVNTSARSHRLKVTLDGVVIFDATSVSVNTDAVYFPVIGQLVPINGAGGNFNYLQEPIFFDKSLLVEYASSLTEVGQTYIAYRYYSR